MHLVGLIYLTHISSHTGVTVNERADALDKEGTTLDVTKTQLPLQKFYINRQSERQTECINTFQFCWKVLKRDIMWNN